MFTLITVFIIEILAGAEVDIFVPSFPELRKVFNLSPFMVELTLGVNLTAQFAASLMVGNLGDRYGRKPIILAGLITFIIGSVCCVFAPNYLALLLGRLLQGVGISGPAVLVYVVIADIYSTKKQQKIMGMLTGVVTIAMALAPIIGSYVSLIFGWHGNFVILLLMGMLCLVLSIFFIPKGKADHSVSLSLKEYINIFKSKKAILYIITICFFIQPYWIFISLSPILYIDDYGISLEHFGFYQGALCGVFAVLSLSSGYFLNKFGQKRCFITSMFFYGLFIISCCVLIIFNIQNPIIITLVCLLQSIGTVFPIIILWPLSLEAVPNSKGRMSAIQVALRLIITSVGVQIVSYYYQGIFLQLGIAMCLTLVFGMWACYKLWQQDNFFTAAK